MYWQSEEVNAGRSRSCGTIRGDPKRTEVLQEKERRLMARSIALARVACNSSGRFRVESNSLQYWMG